MPAARTRTQCLASSGSRRCPTRQRHVLNVAATLAISATVLHHHQPHPLITRPWRQFHCVGHACQPNTGEPATSGRVSPTRLDRMRGVQGVIKGGGVQWMTAGRGIVHAEMPQITSGDLHGFQLWINLPKKDKMIKPRYQDYQASDIPTVDNGDSASVRVMAGTFLETTGAHPEAAPDVARRHGQHRHVCRHVPHNRVTRPPCRRRTVPARLLHAPRRSA